MDFGATRLRNSRQMVNSVTAMVQRPHTPKQRAPRRSRSSITIADVASAAGVSAMTVSRVINNEPKVTARTKQLVERVVAQLGYVPNPAARSLAGGRQCRIALLHSNPSAAYLSEFLVGSLEGASQSGAQLIVEHCGPGTDASSIMATLAAHRVDAVLFTPPLSDDAALLELLRKSGQPFAQIATGSPDPKALSVTIDDEAAAYTMTSRLIEQGHRRIGFIGGEPNQASSTLRLNGYRRALRDANLADDETMIVGGDFTYRSGMKAAEALLALKPRPTAIFASNDDMAAAAVAVAHRLRLDVPNDLSVCGFDDTSIATTIWPELTTIRQPVVEMAKQGMRMLIEGIHSTLAGEAVEPCNRQLPYELIVRASDAPPHSIIKG